MTLMKLHTWVFRIIVNLSRPFGKKSLMSYLLEITILRKMSNKKDTGVLRDEVNDACISFCYHNISDTAVQEVFKYS